MKKSFEENLMTEGTKGEYQKKNIYKQKLNSFFYSENNNSCQNTSSHMVYETSKDIDMDQETNPKMNKASMLGESISKRRMKLKGLGFGTETNPTRTFNEKRPSTPSSIYEHENNLITNISDRECYGIRDTGSFHVQFEHSRSKKKDNGIQNQFFQSKNFLTNLENCQDYFEANKILVQAEKNEQIYSIMSTNSVKFPLPIMGLGIDNSNREFTLDGITSPNLEYQTVTSTNGQMINIEPTDNSIGDQNLQIYQTNYQISEENKELKSECKYYQNEYEKLKLSYNKLRKKYTILKENNSILMTKFERERASHNESRGFLKRQLQVKNFKNSEHHILSRHTHNTQQYPIHNDLSNLRYGRGSINRDTKPLTYTQYHYGGEQYNKAAHHKRTASGGVFDSRKFYSRNNLKDLDSTSANPTPFRGQSSASRSRSKTKREESSLDRTPLNSGKYLKTPQYIKVLKTPLNSVKNFGEDRIESTEYLYSQQPQEKGNRERSLDKIMKENYIKFSLQEQNKIDSATNSTKKYLNIDFTKGRSNEQWNNITNNNIIGKDAVETTRKLFGNNKNCKYQGSHGARKVFFYKF